MGTDPIFLICRPTARARGPLAIYARAATCAFCTPASLLHSRLLLDDQSCAPASHAARSGRPRPPHEISEPMLRTARQQKDRAQRHALGGSLSVLSRCLGALRAHVLPIYRAEPGPGRHGFAS